MSEPAPIVEFAGVVKHYQALRPLRLANFRVSPSSVVALQGIDAVAAEVFVNLVTAAMRPDEGDVRLFGRSTAEIGDYEQWLAMLDGLGLVTERAVLLAHCSVAQNLALPTTLEIEPIRPDVVPIVEALAAEVGIPRDALGLAVAQAGPDIVQRVRLGRALALGPSLVIAEHPSASLPRDAVAGFARDLARIAGSRRLTLVAISADRDFIKALGGTVLSVDPSSGVVSRPGLLERLAARLG